MRNMLFVLATLLAQGAESVSRADPPGKETSRKPLTSRELSGTWRGEKDGARIEIAFKGADKARWNVETRKPRASSSVQVDLRLVDVEKSGCVELRTYLLRDAQGRQPFSLLGRLERGRDGSLRLTMLPDALKQSDSYYQLVKDFSLTAVADAK